MTIWTDTEPIEASTRADVAELQSDRLAGVEARVHVLACRCDDLLLQLKRQGQRIAAQQVAIVRLAKGKTLCGGD